MQFLVAYKCTSSKNKGDPATLLSIGHKDRLISWASLKKKKTSWKNHVTSASSTGALMWFPSYIFIRLLYHMLWRPRKVELLPSFWREFTEVTGFVFMEQYSCLWGSCQSEESHTMGVGQGILLKWISSEILSGSSRLPQRKHHAVP